MSQTFFLYLFDHSRRSGEEIFFFSTSLVIFWHGLFSKVFLMASWFINRDLPDRRQSFRASKIFKRYSSLEQSFCLRSAT